MRLQIVSDIHLEFYSQNFPVIEKHAGNVALLGDIGKPFTYVYERFLFQQSETFDHVFVILGNHEYYNANKTMDKIILKARPPSFKTDVREKTCGAVDFLIANTNNDVEPFRTTRTIKTIRRNWGWKNGCHASPSAKHVRLKNSSSTSIT